MRLLRGVAAGALLALLAACVTPPQPVADGSAFLRAGRFALTSESTDSKPQAVQGGFVWRDDGRNYQLDLTDPLGAVQARIRGTPREAVLTRADGFGLEAPDPDTLIQEATGNPMPVSGLRDWLRGRVADSARNVVRDEQGRPVEFEQMGWRARLSRYDALGPQLLVLRRDDARRQLSVRLVVNP